MTSTTLVLLVLAATATPIKLGATDFPPAGISDEQARFFGEHLAVKLAGEEGIVITTPKDIASILGAERQKALLGCADDTSSCMIELAGALGVEALVTGQVAKVGQSYQLNVKILAADRPDALFVYASDLLPNEEAVVRELNRVAARAAQALFEKLRPAQQRPAGGLAAAGPARPLHPLLPSALGIVAAGVGGGLLIGSGVEYARLSEPGNWSSIAPDTFRNDVKNAQTAQEVGIALAAVGGAAIVAGLIWFFATPPGAPVVTATVGPNGASVGVVGVFP